MQMTHSKLYFLLFIACSILSCSEDRNPFDVEDIVRSSIHFLNTFPGAGSVDLVIKSFDEDKIIATNIGFGEGWPKNGYASLLDAPDQDTSLNIKGGLFLMVVDNDTRDSLVQFTLLRLSPGRRNSLVLIDSVGKPLLVKTNDNFQEPPQGTANARFMNVNSNYLSISLVDEDFSFSISRLNFLNYSDFQFAPLGTRTYYFVDDFSGARLDSIPNVNVQRDKVYSFYFTQQEGRPIGGLELLE